MRTPFPLHSSVDRQPIAIEPGQFHRLGTTVTISPDAAKAVHRLGGQTTYKAAPVHELHPARVEVAGP